MRSELQLNCNACASADIRRRTRRDSWRLAETLGLIVCSTCMARHAAQHAEHNARSSGQPNAAAVSLLDQFQQSSQPAQKAKLQHLRGPRPAAARLGFPERALGGTHHARGVIAGRQQGWQGPRSASAAAGRRRRSCCRHKCTAFIRHTRCPCPPAPCSWLPARYGRAAKGCCSLDDAPGCAVSGRPALPARGGGRLQGQCRFWE